jgi:hypothetical protein
VGGPIPTAYARADAGSVSKVEMEDDDSDVEESDEVKNERINIQEYLILSFVDRTGIAKTNLELYNKAFESWAKQKNKALSKNHQRRKSNFKASWSTYQDRFQDYIQKNEFATNHGVCDECSKMADKNVMCVHCSVCVHPLPDCCHFYGDQLSCIDCYRRRREMFLPHAICDRDSSQLLAKKDATSNNVKTPPESNEKVRLEDRRKNQFKNNEVPKKDDTARDLKAAHESNNDAEKEDDQKPVAVNKKVDDAALNMKDPPKRVNEEDQTDGKKPAAKEDVLDKKKRRNPKLPLHPNSTGMLPKSIGKSPNMDLADTESESDDEIWEDKLKPWKLITTLKEREMCNLKQAAKDRQKRGSMVRGIPDEADLELLRAAKKQGREERKLKIIQEREEKAYTAELKRLKQAAARKSMPVQQRDIEKCMVILPQMWERGARQNVLNRVKDEMSTIWPITAKTDMQTGR